MKPWLIILFNVGILASWIHLLYLVYTLDPDIQAEWKDKPPSWANEYKSFILSIKTTSFINGILVLLTIVTTLYPKLVSSFLALFSL